MCEKKTKKSHQVKSGKNGQKKHEFGYSKIHRQEILKSSPHIKKITKICRSYIPPNAGHGFAALCL